MLASRANSTLAELLKDYDDKVCDNRLPRKFGDLRRLLQSMPGVECIQNDYGLEMWQIKKPKEKSSKYMKKDKVRASSKEAYGSNKRSNSGTSTKGSYFSTSQPKPKRQQRNHINSSEEKQCDVNFYLSQCQRKIDMDGFFYNYQLMGDDFMISMAKIDLGFKITKDPTTNILHIGSCISGLTIKNLARIVRSSMHIESRVIVYVGTVDILKGRHIETIIDDYFDLMSAFRERGIEPILCTLAPIGENAEYACIINKFNCWLTNRKWRVVDIHRCFLDKKRQTIRRLYQKNPRNVSGCNVPHHLWNKLGRARVLRSLKRFMLGSFNP